MNRAIFLDQEGVITVEKYFIDRGEGGKEVLSNEDVEIYPDVVEFLKMAKEKGYITIVVTNQSKIGRGLISEEELDKMHDYVNKICGNKIDKFYYCPHNRDSKCDCRKPKTGMFKSAEKELSINLSDSWMIGDKTIDIKAGKDAGTRTVLVKTGYGGTDKKFDIKPDHVAENLREAGEIIFSKN